MNSLFRLFAGADPKECSPDVLNGTISIIESIIKEREEESDFDCGLSSLLLLSYPLIGEIGSYCNQQVQCIANNAPNNMLTICHQQEHIDFSKCCRTTYIANNAPNTLYELNLMKVVKFHIADVARFSQIRCFKFHLRDFYLLPLPTKGRISRHLYKMEIDNDGDDRANISELVGCTVFDFDNITDLKLSNFGTQREPHFPETTFCRLMSKFRNLTHLNLHSMYVQPIKSLRLIALKQLLVKLESFTISSGGGMATQIVSLLPPTIKYLYCGWMRLKEFKTMAPLLRSAADANKLSSLEEVALPAISGTESVLQCIGNAAHGHHGLKRVYLNWAKKGCDLSSTTVLPELFRRERGLKELGIRTYGRQIKDICPDIERAITNIGEDARKSIHIKLRLQLALKVAAQDVIEQFMKILKRLQMSRIEDYVLNLGLSMDELDIKCFPDTEEWNQRLQRLKDQIGDKSELTFSECNIMATNKNCKLIEGIWDTFDRQRSLGW